jgi:nitric oxide reductase activation protein
LSDGVPQVGGTYPNNVGIVDTREAAIEIKKQGIEVISLFFGEPDQIKTFRYMYSNPVFVDDINFLPLRLGEVFKRVLLN